VGGKCEQKCAVCGEQITRLQLVDHMTTAHMFLDSEGSTKNAPKERRRGKADLRCVFCRCQSAGVTLIDYLRDHCLSGDRKKGHRGSLK